MLPSLFKERESEAEGYGKGCWVGGWVELQDNNKNIFAGTGSGGKVSPDTGQLPSGNNMQAAFTGGQMDKIADFHSY